MAVCPACNARYESEVTYCPKDGTQVVQEQEDKESSLVGQVIADRYRLTKKLGEGGMGEVYEASHIYIEKRVALKLLRPEIMSNTEAVTRFYQEARSASAIGHENIVAIDDFGKLPDGRVYLTMEFLDGESLNDALQTPMAVDRALDLIIQVCKGLAVAHAKGIVHRDMKPENVFLTKKDGHEIAKILDFGIAKVSGTEGNQNLTRTGTIFGTPHYMSPEQALGKALDHRSDIYSVGVIMYEMFTGAVPFKAESFMGILTQHLTTMPRSPRDQAPERNIPLPVETIILKAMSKEAGERYQKIEELLQDLLKLQEGAFGAADKERPTVVDEAPALALASAPGAAQVGPAGAGPMAAPPAEMSAALTAPRPATPSQAWDARLPPTAPVTVQGPYQSVVPAAAPARIPPTGLAHRPPRKKGKAGLIIFVVVGLLVLGVGGGAAYYYQDELFGTEPTARKPVQPPPGKRGVRRPPGKRVGKRPPAKGVATRPPTKVRRPVPVWTSVQVTSTPMGAAIYHEGQKLGVTPANVKVPPDRSISYELRLSGYESYSISLNPGTTAKQHAMMTKISKTRSKPRPRPKPRPKPPRDPYERL